MEVPKDQIATLMEHGLYDSAEMLGCFLVSSSTVSAETSPHLKAENLILLGDALFHQREYRRAIHTYKQALHHCTRIPKSNISRSSLSLSTRSSVNASSISAINESEVKFKIASSHFALNETKAAIAEMESVKTRSLEMNILMAKLHRNSGYNRGAIAFYKECLRQCPYVLEAIIGLAELGVTAKDIISAFTQTSNRSAKVSLDQIDPTRWLQRYVEAQCCVASHAYKGALELFAELLQRFPNNVHLLTETAKVEAIIGKNDEAIMRFEKVRSIDPYTLTCMDEYAMLLQIKCDYSRLNKLVHDLLTIDHTRAEVQSHVSIGANDLLIVGPGVLGRLVAEKWREEHPDCQIIGQTVTTNHHDELEKLGIKPALKGTEFDGKFSYVIFCAPPSQSPDYAAELRMAASKWNGEGSFLFTSSSAPFDCFDNGECNEDSPVVPLGKSPRTDVLLRAEKVVLESGGTVLRLAGLYTETRGAHTYWLSKETVDARPEHFLNLIHYEDAASLAVAIMKKKAGGRIFLGCDNHPLSRQEVMDLMAQSEKYDKKFKGFTSNSGPLGKKLNNSQTRAEIGWEPKYPSFAQFLGVSK